MAIQSVNVEDTNTDIFVSNGNKLISTMIFCNVGSQDPLDDLVNLVSLSIHLVKSGQTPSATNKIVNALEVPASETVFFDTERIVLENGDRIVAIASASSLVSCTISTVDI
jgi:hypothetical protein